MKISVLVVTLLTLSLACAKKQSDFVVAHRYTLNGTVVSLNPKDHTASINAAAIPNYMEAMQMDYSIKSEADFNQLRVGEKITATLNVNATNDEYNLTGIQEAPSNKK